MTFYDTTEGIRVSFWTHGGPTADVKTDRCGNSNSYLEIYNFFRIRVEVVIPLIVGFQPHQQPKAFLKLTQQVRA